MGVTKDFKTEYVPERIRELLSRLRQPITIKQWSKMSAVVFEQCRQIFLAARRRDLIKCINPAASRHRLYFLTFKGIKEQRKLRRKQRLLPIEFDLPAIDWKLFGDCCYPHRAAIIKTIDDPMQPSHIRRIAVRNDSKLKMSGGNAREVVRFLKKQGIVRPVKVRKKAHFHYELSEIGKHFKRLLKQAEVLL